LSLKTIIQPYAAEMQTYEGTLRDILQSDIRIVDKISRYIVRHKGKNLRPFIVLLSALLNGKATENTYRIAVTVELLHTASLVHDDVVDESELRRGFPSINAIWKNKVSVLMGDYLLAKSLISATETGILQVMNTLANAARQLSQGELQQIQKVWRQNINEDEYRQIIRNKTAALIAACFELGAISVAAPEEKVKAMADFGEALGMAFQIKDDLLDYQSSATVLGKPVGNDLREKKYTLPLIYALQKAPQSEQKRIRKMMSRGPGSSEISQIVQFAEQYGGIAYAESEMRRYQKLGMEILSVYSEAKALNSVKALFEFVITRQK
jgi:octaprenyl-diphosphate synthase